MTVCAPRASATVHASSRKAELPDSGGASAATLLTTASVSGHPQRIRELVEDVRLRRRHEFAVREGANAPCQPLDRICLAPWPFWSTWANRMQIGMQIRAGNQSKRHFHITCHAEAGLERTITSSICNVIAPDAVLDALDNILSRICARPLVAHVRSLRSRRAYRRGASCGITFEFGVQSVGSRLPEVQRHQQFPAPLLARAARADERLSMPLLSYSYTAPYARLGAGIPQSTMCFVDLLHSILQVQHHLFF